MIILNDAGEASDKIMILIHLSLRARHSAKPFHLSVQLVFLITQGSRHRIMHFILQLQGQKHTHTQLE